MAQREKTQQEEESFLLNMINNLDQDQIRTMNVERAIGNIKYPQNISTFLFAKNIKFYGGVNPYIESFLPKFYQMNFDQQLGALSLLLKMENHISTSEENQAILNSILNIAAQNVRFKNITVSLPMSVVLYESNEGEILKNSSFHHLRFCNVCNKKKLYICDRCNGPAYCSKECQKIDWIRGHKQNCHSDEKIENYRLRIAMKNAMNNKLFKNIFKNALNVEHIIYKNFTSRWEGGNFMITIDVPPVEHYHEQDIMHAILLHKNDGEKQYIGNELNIMHSMLLHKNDTEDQFMGNINNGWVIVYNDYDENDINKGDQYSVVYIDINMKKDKKRKSKRKGKK